MESFELLMIKPDEAVREISDLEKAKNSLPVSTSTIKIFLPTAKILEVISYYFVQAMNKENDCKLFNSNIIKSNFKLILKAFK